MSNCFRGANGELLTEFLRPQVSKASSYRRAVGFFSSSVFESAPGEFLSFFQRGGRFELVCSHHFRADDLAALVAAIEQPARIPALGALAANARGLLLLQSAFLSGQLAIKVARPKSRRVNAIYHEKIGVLSGIGSPSVCFEGSANESRSAYESNFERIVAHSIRSEAGQGIDLHLRKLWANDTVGLEVKPFFEALREGWIVVDSQVPELRVEQSRLPSHESVQSVYESSGSKETLLPPSDLVLRSYQCDAVDAWFQANGRGIFEMATGSGKTLTALSLATRLYREAGGPLVIIIVAPLLHLVDQWIGVAGGFGLSPVRCAGSSASWVPDAQDSLHACNAGRTPLASFVVSLATFAGTQFQALVNTIQVRTLLIVDEVHNAGSSQMARALPVKVNLRLGLSATPHRHKDDAGTDRLSAFFGKVVFKFGIAEALQAKPPVLTPYRYEPILVPLSGDEADEYIELTRAIVRLVGASDDVADWPTSAQFLLIKRARIVAGCRGKLVALRDALRPFASESHTLVYCGDGTAVVGNDDHADSSIDASDEVVRQIDAVTHIMGHELGMAVRRYTAVTPPEDRRLIEQQFQDGALQAIVAIRCLDEGVDLPATRRAFILASSTNPRQFIQRRGRVLRRSPGKERAEIFDFVVLPPIDGVERATVASIKGLFRREMARVIEFAQTSTNQYQALDTLRPALEKYDLLHLLASE